MIFKTFFLKGSMLIRVVNISKNVSPQYLFCFSLGKKGCINTNFEIILSLLPTVIAKYTGVLLLFCAAQLIVQGRQIAQILYLFLMAMKTGKEARNFSTTT